MKRKEYQEKLARRREETDLLAKEVGKVQEEMAATLNNFSGTNDPDLLEYYTYYYKANEIKHSYLLRRLKEIYYGKVE